MGQADWCGHCENGSPEGHRRLRHTVEFYQSRVQNLSALATYEDFDKRPGAPRTAHAEYQIALADLASLDATYNVDTGTLTVRCPSCAKYLTQTYSRAGV